MDEGSYLFCSLGRSDIQFPCCFPWEWKLLLIVQVAKQNMVVQEFDVWLFPMPADFSIDFNPCSLSDLKKIDDWREPRKFSDELTDKNFCQWLMIEFLPNENDERIEFDGWFDFWCVLAEVNGELKIGYFEFEDVG